MKMLLKQKVFFGLILSLGLGVGGCGNVSVDPLELMSNSTPVLNSITASSGAISSYVQGTFSQATPYWVFNTSFSGFANNLTAPASGQIAEIGVSNITGANGYYVTLIHSGRMETKIFGVQNITGLKVGDYVLAGQVIAQFYPGSIVGFQVLYSDGTNGPVPVCPFSYLSTAFRQSLYTYTSSQLCQ